MVNISKRMHNLMPRLWAVKNGPGAAIIPPKAPAPQITSMVLRIPNPCNGYDQGARDFWRIHLPGLRYHNLTVPIKVQQEAKPGPSFVPTLTLQLESPERGELEKVSMQPNTSDTDALVTAKARLHQIRSMMQVNAQEKGVPFEEPKPNAWVQTLRAEQESAGTPEGQGTHIGEIEVKAQPPADPATPSTTSPPQAMYTRTLRLGLRGRSAPEIFAWFKQVTRTRRWAPDSRDRNMANRYRRFFKRAQADRERVKAGIDAVKREKEELKRAREAADQMTAEA